MIPAIEVGIPDDQHLGCLEKNIGHIIDRILSLFGNPAQGDGLGGCGPAKQIVCNIRQHGHMVGKPHDEAACKLNSSFDIGFSLLV